jgi:hypothetical protein
MFGDNTFTQDMLTNPGKIVKAVIDEMEASDTTGRTVIQDPNNGFVMQMAATAAIFSKLSEKIDYTYAFYFAQRARNAKQLYTHLSEFDYVKLMASPATLPFVFAMSRQWIIDKSVYYDTNYNKIQIPKHSSINMGGVIYSMYYPIDILVNRNTGAVTAFYASDDEPLSALKSNMLLDVQQYVKDAIDIFQITFNMYQFERKILPFTSTSEVGFIQTIPYDDQFYALRAFSQARDGTWNELSYSLESMNYDFKKPTMIIDLSNDTNQIRVEIPQIYFDNRQVSQNIKIELYTTKGKVNYPLSLGDVTGLTANFDPQSSPFAAPLDQPPVESIFPTVLEVSGGSDAMTYDEIREAIVNQRLSNRVAITTPEIIQAGKRAGFDITRERDDLTERIYYASNVLADSKGMVVPTFTGNILLADEALKGNPSTIIDYTDGYYTMLPTTTFSISESGLVCKPMTDAQIEGLNQLTKEQLVRELNTGTYVRQPFHITLLTSPKSPQALIYNLLTPGLTSLTFVSENAHSAPQMSVTAGFVNHLGNGTGGYQILLDLTRSSNIVNEDVSNFNVVLTCTTKVGTLAYIPATYVSTNDNGIDVWAVNLSTSYHITTDDHITVMMYDVNDNLNYVEISLNETFNVITTFNKGFDDSVPVESSLNLLLPEIMRDSQIAMAQQIMVLSLGNNLSSKIYCGVNTTWGNDVYQTADETSYYVTDAPVFQFDETGILNHRINPVTKGVEIVVLYPQGSTPSDTSDIIVPTNADTYVSSSGTTTTLKITDTRGLLEGMPVRGTNLPVNSKVVTVTGDSVVISGTISKSILKGTKVTFTNSEVLTRTTAEQAAAGDVLTIASTRDLLVGESVFGFDIPEGARVKRIVNGTSFTITIPTTTKVKNGTLLTIINTTAPGVVKIAVGSVVRDPTGSPVVVKSAQNEYLIPAILFDGRLFASDDPNDQKIVTTISQYLQNYANQIDTIDAGLIERSDVFYKPARTMGYASFGVGGGKTLTLPLALSLSFTVYVDASVYNSQKLQSTMTESIISIVNKAIQDPTISVSKITNVIENLLGTNVSAVEGGDISGIDDLRLIALEESGARPSIENILSIQSDGSIKRLPNIAVTYLPKPDDSEVANSVYL